MDICIIETGLKYAIRNVKDLAPKLTWHEQKNDVAVASVGNTLIGLWERTENTTQMEIEVFRSLKVGEYFKQQRDDAARVLCDALIRDLRSIGLLKFYPIKSRIADETLRDIHFNENDNQAELAKPADKTAEQAAVEYLERSKIAATPTEPTTTQAQLPAPTDVPKTTNWSRSDKIALVGVVVTIAAILVPILLAWLSSQGTLQNSIYAGTPILTPTFVSPTATP